MQKRAYGSTKHYQKLFAPLPVSSDVNLYFDKDSSELPYAEDFPKLHYHDRYEIGICESGGGLFLSEGIFSSVSKGDLIFIAPECCHYSRSLNKDEPCICRFAYLRAETVERLISFATSADEEKEIALKCTAKGVPAVIRAHEYPQAAALLSEIIEVCRQDTSDGAALAALRLSVFILEAQSLFGNTPSTAYDTHRLDDVVAKISEYLSLHYNGSDTARELAARCHLSESQLRRRFLAVYDMPPIAYRNFLRCKIAAELLTRTRLPISKIADRIGYTAVSDFYRAFKKIHGRSPSAYRAEKSK